MRNGHKRGSVSHGEGLGEQVRRDLDEHFKEWSTPSQPSIGHCLATRVGTAVLWPTFNGCDTSSTCIIETNAIIILEKAGDVTVFSLKVDERLSSAGLRTSTSITRLVSGFLSQ